MLIDPTLLSRPADEAVKRFNDDIIARSASLPDPWAFPVARVREARAAGGGALPVEPRNPDAVVETLEGPRGEIEVRLIAPPGEVKGGYLHIHGGGWTFGTAGEQDRRLTRLAGNTGLLVCSVEYRLAPEFPYPAGPDDCEAAALWFLDEVKKRHGVEWCAIGGESAGANLSVVTLLRLNHLHGDCRFRAANLNAGCYDLTLTPSARNWGQLKLILNTRDIEMFVRHYLLHGHDPLDPDVSPIFAELAAMPPALFTVGTMDPLLDDTLFMAARWAAAGNPTDLAIYTGGCHVFDAFETEMAGECLSRMEAFVNRVREAEAG